MITFYFKLQLKRIYRILKEVGFPPIITMCGIPILFGWISYVTFTKTEYGHIGYIIVGLWSISLLSDVKRNLFLKKLFDKKSYYNIRLIENLLVGIMFIMFLCIFSKYVLGMGLFIASILFTLVNFSNSANLVIPTPFSKRPFEFSVGFRKFYWLYGIMYYISFMAIKVENFNLGLFTLIVLSLLNSQFFTIIEPKQFVWFHNSSSKDFLLKKIKTAFWYNFLSCLPIYIGLVITFPKEIYGIVAIQIVSWLFMSSYIFMKYKYFPNHPNISDIIIVVLCLTFPPMYLIFTPKLYNDAKENLNTLL